MASRQQYMLEILLGAKTAASYQSNIRNAKQGINSLSSSAKKAAGLITAAFATVNLTGAIKDAVDVYSGFEQELASSAAIAGASDAEYRKMEKASREAGKATIKTARESASALGYMALAGWDVNESTQGLMPVLKLSAATNLDLAETSDLVTDSMSALKLKVKDLPEYLDMVTKANNSANTTSEQLMQAFIKTGGAARTLKIDAQDTGTALGILANNGTKAEEGGRTMNAILTRIASNKNALEELDALDIHIFEKGEFVGLEEALKRINKGIAGLSVEKKAKSLKNIAGTQYYSKMAYLLDGVKEGANGAISAWDELESKLDSSGGSLDEMYDKMTNTMSGATETMKSAMDDAKISFADAFDGEMIEVVNDLGGAFNIISDNISNFSKENEVEIHQTFEEIKEGVLAVGDTIGKFGGFIADNFDIISSGIAGVGAALAAYKVAKGIFGIADSLVAVATSPMGWIAVAGAGLASVGAYAIKSHEKMVKAGLEEHFGNVSLSLEDLDEIAQEIVGKKSLTKISVMLESIGKTDESIENMKDSLSEVDKISWKLNAGFKIDKSDRELYTESVKDYVKYAQETLDNQGYTVHVATDLLLGKNSKIGRENDAFYSGLDAEMNRLQKQLNKKIKKAVKNGVDIDTDESIQTLLQKMSDITDGVTEAQNEAKLQAIDLKYSGRDLTATDFKQISKDLKGYEEQVGSGAEDAYISSMTTLNARLKTGDISQKKYNKEAKKYKQGYYDTQADAMLNSSEYILKTIQQTYPEVNSAMADIQKDLQKGFKDAVKNGVSANVIDTVFDSVVKDAMSKVEVSGDVQDQIVELFKAGLGGIWSDMEDLENQIKNSNLDVPKSLSESVNDMQSLSALTGSVDDAMLLLGKSISESDELSTVVTACKEVGGYIPEEIANEMNNNSDQVIQAANNVISILKNSFEGKMSFQITMDMVANQMPYRSSMLETNNVKQNSTSATSNMSLPSLINKSRPKAKKLHKNDAGGIYRNPILTTFAEMGPEAAIPLDGSSRAKALWQNAGQILGMIPTEDKTLYNTLSSPNRDREIYDTLSKVVPSSSEIFSGAQNIQISYAPTIEVKGSADEKTLMNVVRLSQEEFAEMLDNYLLAKGRVSFGN